MSNLANRRIRIGRDDGFTLIEVIIVMVMTSILAGIFAQILVSAMEIYTTQNFRKTAHIDMKRGMDTAVRDLRELLSWDGAPTTTNLQFEKAGQFEYNGFFSRIYYDEKKSQLTLSGGDMLYRREMTYYLDDIWGTQFPLIKDDINMGTSSFNPTTSHGVDIIEIYIQMTVNNSPIAMRTTVFPRIGG